LCRGEPVARPIGGTDRSSLPGGARNPLYRKGNIAPSWLTNNSFVLACLILIKLLVFGTEIVMIVDEGVLKKGTRLNLA